MLYILLANGFEEIEALATVDFLRRSGVDVRMASVTGTRMVTGAHAIPVMADCLMRRAEIEQSDGVILPGGMPGAETLRTNAVVRRIVETLAAADKLVAAICAAPMVLGDCGLLKGRRAVCYPGFEPWLKGAEVPEGEVVVEDGPFITSKGPGTALPFAEAIARRFVSAEQVEAVKNGMLLG
ncbi:MAG: DJ-1/PfpI family protein [Bacteroidaceae bacterium]|nr:DJ-1/PfpI family protein [Bacteroidaceae bacterium]